MPYTTMPLCHVASSALSLVVASADVEQYFALSHCILTSVCKRGAEVNDVSNETLKRQAMTMCRQC